MGTTAEKLTYLNTTKEKIRDSINLTGANLTSEDTFRSYASKLKKGYIDIINNGIDTLYNNFPKVSGIGSNLSLTPTYETPMKLNEIQGDTLQDGTPTPDTPVEIQSVTGLQNINVCGKNLFSGYTKGIKINTSNGAEYSDNTGASSDYIPLNIVGSNLFLIGGLPNNLFNFVCAYNSNKTFLGRTSAGAITSRELNSNVFIGGTPQGTGDIAYIRVTIYENNSVSGVIDDIDNAQIQLEQGSTATTYEPYTGNTYEVNLGKNLLPNIATTTTKNGITFTKNSDGTYTVSGTATANAVFSILTEGDLTNPTLQTGTYTLSGCPSGGSGNTYKLDISVGSYNQDTGSGVTFTLSEATQINYVRILVYSGQTINAVFKPMIEKGSQVTSYSPYFTPIELNKIGTYQDSIKKSTGKNLCTGVRKSSSNNDLFFDFGNNVSQTITLSATINSQTQGNSIYLSVDGVNKGKIGEMTGTANTKQTTTITFTNEIYEAIQNSTTCFLQLYRNNAGFVIPNDGQINNGSTALPYEPYGKVWYVEKNIGKVVLDGSETQWARWFSTPGVYSCSNLIQTINNATGINCISNYYSNTYSRAYVRDNLETIDKNIATNGGELIIANKSYTTLSDFKNWLSTHNTTVYTILATPTYTEITNTELIEDLETLYTAKSQEGTTNISITSEDLEMILNVSALKGDA